MNSSIADPANSHKARPLVYKLQAIARLLMGLPLLVFGLNGFLNFLPQPTTPLHVTSA